MSAPDRRRIVLGSDTHRAFVGSLVASCPAGYVVTIEPPRRTIDQNALWHAMLDELAKKCPTYAGVPMDAARWKTLIKVSFAQAEREANGDKRPLALVPDLEETGLVQLCEQSSRMSKARSSALIEYTAKVAAEQGIELEGKHE